MRDYQSIAKTEQALALRGVTHRYGGVLALDNVTIEIPKGGFVSVLGSNGAGKSTIAMLLAGLATPTSGRVEAGAGEPIAEGSAMAKDISLVPEGRRLFGQLSVRDNILLGGYAAGLPKAEIRSRMDKVLESLPRAVRDNPGRACATLSGGEAQMVAIGRALMAAPQVLIIDEPSMGLAPILIGQVYQVLADLHRRGTTILLMEQMATNALRHSDHMIIMDRGRLAYAGSPKGEGANAALVAGYIGEEAH